MRDVDALGRGTDCGCDPIPRRKLVTPSDATTLRMRDVDALGRDTDCCRKHDPGHLILVPYPETQNASTLELDAELPTEADATTVNHATMDTFEWGHPRYTISNLKVRPHSECGVLMP